MIRIFIPVLAIGLTLWQAQAEESLIKVVPLGNGVDCIRVTRIPADFAAQLQAQLTNKVPELVMDFRFADGGATFPATHLLPAQKSPIVVLVNIQTRGAAADLAAQLRASGRAILIGGTNVTGKIVPDITITANSEQEKKFQENPYASTDKPAALPDNHDVLPFVDHTSEADLVRRRLKDGDESLADSPRAAPDQPVIRDPALARAVDLFKALAVLNKSRG